MTIFLALSALMNIALGYGLAVYLGRASSPLATQHDDEPEVDSFPEAVDVHVPQPVAAASPALPVAPMAPVAQPTAPAELAAAPVPAPASTPAPEPAAEAAESAELETDVLAGIEEFRNQLAQMKAQPAGVDAPAAADALAAKPALATADA